MRITAKGQLLAMSLGLSFFSSGVAAQEAEVIYGDDDRRDVYQETDASLVELARSTAVLVNASSLKAEPNDPFSKRLPGTTFGSSMNMCAGEPFRAQPNPGFCSGFLVGENILVTAGHCVQSQTECSSTAFVFGFSYETQDQDVTLVPDSNIFRCKRLIASEVNRSTQTDYAVIELDRSVADRTPLKFRTEGKVAVGEALTLIGHPSGLPTKIAGGASVRSTSPAAYFVANVDAFGGNSGSAVFNTATGEVEGILVRGETDFVSRGGCRVSNKCSNTGCRGEDITRSTEFARFVPTEPDQPSRPTQDHSVDASNLGLAIPDNNANGVTVELEMVEAGTIADVGLHVTLEHTFIGDLKIVLIHPDGTEAVVVDGNGGATDDLDQTFGLNGMYVGDFANFKGKDAAGTWRMRVIDKAARDTGVLQYARLTTQVFIPE